MSLERLSNVEGAVGAVGPTGATGSVMPKFSQSGKYFACSGAVLGGSSGTVTDGTCHYAPFYVGDAFTVDRIGFWLTTAGTSGSVQRLGIYNDTGAGKPGTVLLDAGTVASDTGGGTLREITISQALSAGTLYWLTIAQQGAPGTTASIRRASGQMPYPVLQYAGSGTSFVPQNCWASTGITGAFASTPTVTLAGSFMHIVVVRAA